MYSPAGPHRTICMLLGAPNSTRALVSGHVEGRIGGTAGVLHPPAGLSAETPARAGARAINTRNRKFRPETRAARIRRENGRKLKACLAHAGPFAVQGAKLGIPQARSLTQIVPLGAAGHHTGEDTTNMRALQLCALATRPEGANSSFTSISRGQQAVRVRAVRWPDPHGGQNKVPAVAQVFAEVSTPENPSGGRCDGKNRAVNARAAS